LTGCLKAAVAGPAWAEETCAIRTVCAEPEGLRAAGQSAASLCQEQ